MRVAPRVSVVMPAYNAEAYIREAVDSILSQSFKDFELIILDDGSIDATAAIIQSYSDKRIRLIQKQNEGVAATLNRGVEMAKGDYIWRHDADDISKTDRLEKQFHFISEHPEVILCSTQIAFMTERGNVAYTKRQPKEHWFGDTEVKEVTFEDFNPFSPITHATILVRTDVMKKLQGYRIAFPTSEDIDLWMRMLDLGKMVVMNDCSYYVRLSKTSATAKHGWKNEYYRELAKKYWHQRKEGNKDDLEINGYIKEPEAPKAPSNPAEKPGRIFRSDLLNFHYSVHLDAGDWREVLRIIQLALIDGWRLPQVHRAILLPLLPRILVKGAVATKSLLRRNTVTS